MHALGRLRDRLAAAGVLTRRGMVDPVRPDQALRAFVAMRRHGAFGGLVAYTAARYGDAPAITDDDGTITFREKRRTARVDRWSAAVLVTRSAAARRHGAVDQRNHRDAKRSVAQPD
jgi:fatty-acyl-CoA synthase